MSTTLRPLSCDDPRYPARLAELTPAPPLWIRGALALEIHETLVSARDG